MTRDELLADIEREVKIVLPENEQLDGEGFDTVRDVVAEVLDTAEKALDDDADDADAEEA